MKRRDFLVSSAGLAAGTLPLIGKSAATPCPPGTVAVAGGTTAQTACSANVGAADWPTRSSGPGVVAAYDFSNPPANGGTWQFGSTSANPKVTVWGMNNAQSDVFPNRVLDTTIYPPGSTASLRFDVPGNSGERSDAWRISLDNYADQFGAGDEFWVQWRQRWDTNYTTENFLARSGAPTGAKMMMVSAGMQFPYCAEGTPQTSYGYQGPGTSEAYNVIQQARIDSDGEIVVGENMIPAMHPNNPTNLRYPGNLYVTKYFDDLSTRGQDISYFTTMNQGNESAHLAACQFSQPGGVGNQWTDYMTCFLHTPNTWLTFMSHVILGPWGTQVISGQNRTGYTNSVIELWGAYPGQPMRLLHRRTWPLAQYNGPQQGAQGVQRYGQFGFTTFMTGKDPAQSHPTARMWYGQVIVKRGSVPIPAPVA